MTADISYKFHRLFPLSQYDLPSHNDSILSLTSKRSSLSTQPPASHSKRSDGTLARITQEQIAQENPDVDYTRYVRGQPQEIQEGSLMVASQPRSHFAGVFGCRKPDTGRSQSISCGNVCRVKTGQRKGRVRKYFRRSATCTSTASAADRRSGLFVSTRRRRFSFEVGVRMSRIHKPTHSNG